MFYKKIVVVLYVIGIAILLLSSMWLFLEIKVNRSLLVNLSSLRVKSLKKVYVPVAMRMGKKNIYYDLKGVFGENFQVGFSNRYIGKNAISFYAKTKSYVPVNVVISDLWTLSSLFDVKLENFCIGLGCKSDYSSNYIYIKGGVYNVNIIKHKS